MKSKSRKPALTTRNSPKRENSSRGTRHPPQIHPPPPHSNYPRGRSPARAILILPVESPSSIATVSRRVLKLPVQVLPSIASASVEVAAAPEAITAEPAPSLLGFSLVTI